MEAYTDPYLIPPHHLAVPDSDTLDNAQLAPTTQLSDLIELACRWNKSFGIDLGNVEIRVLLKEPSPVTSRENNKTPSPPTSSLQNQSQGGTPVGA